MQTSVNAFWAGAEANLKLTWRGLRSSSGKCYMVQGFWFRILIIMAATLLHSNLLLFIVVPTA